MSVGPIPELAKSIGTFTSWMQVFPALVQLIDHLDRLCDLEGEDQHKAYVYGAMCALNEACQWDSTHHPERDERTILRMLVEMVFRQRALDATR